jgi:hypothetical protein
LVEIVRYAGREIRVLLERAIGSWASGDVYFVKKIQQVSAEATGGKSI